jgi:hypothetical protein
MYYKELLQLIREIFPEQDIRIREETYLRTKYPIIYIKSKTYSMEIKNQRIGTITIPDKWQIKIPAEQTDYSKQGFILYNDTLKIPDQNIKEFISLVGLKLLELESLQVQLDLFHKNLNDLKTNPEEQIRDFKLNNLLYEKN